MMRQQAIHALLPDANHDELARQDFVFELKSFVANALAPGCRTIYEERVKPAFQTKSGRGPNRHEIRRMMSEIPYYQAVSSMKRIIQEFTWDTVGESIERQLPSLVEKARRVRDRTSKLGTLRLDPDLAAPRYLDAVDIHAMPGGYHTEIVEDDVYAGALYDRGVYLFILGGLGANNEDYGDSLIAFLGHNFADLRPRRILDIGCTVGASTLPFARAFPEAEVHAIDVAAPPLRYGHARAELFGTAIHFSQQNAEHTDFDDQSFDLIVSHGMAHETSNRALRNIYAECFRLLRPGGLMVLGEARQYTDIDPYDASLHDWATHYNAEPFMGKMHDTDLVQLAVDAGFRREDSFPQVSVESTLDRGGEGGGQKFQEFVHSGAWFFSGATKRSPRAIGS